GCHGLVQVERSAEVGVEGLVDRQVEGDGGGGVDHHVQVTGKCRHVVQVPGEDVDASGDLIGSLIGSDPFPPGREAILLEQLGHPLLCGDLAARAHQERQTGRRIRGQELLDNSLPDESGCARHQDVSVLQWVRHSGYCTRNLSLTWPQWTNLPKARRIGVMRPTVARLLTVASRWSTSPAQAGSASRYSTTG